MLSRSIETAWSGAIPILIRIREVPETYREKPCLKYTEFKGGHEPISWRGTLSDGLITLLEAP